MLGSVRFALFDNGIEAVQHLSNRARGLRKVVKWTVTLTANPGRCHAAEI